tara:strand:+ start:227 stop:1369 length:1143 start_codon:yes stop_codon:yes gene_type:complete
MSSLLERAIVDATALKEAALKNAENLVIEKYSQEVKDAMQSLLEAPEDDPFAEENPLADADPFADPLSTETDPTLDPTTNPEEENQENPYEDSILADIPDGFDPDLEDPDDELVDIKLDSIRAELPDLDIPSEEDRIGISIDRDTEEEAPSLDTTPSIEPPAPSGPSISPEMVAEVLADMDIDEDIDLDELVEAVRVDFEPQKSGWAGTPETIMREYESMLLAREQDSEVKEENEELRKTVAALQKENKILASAATKLEAQSNRYVSALEALQEKLESVNVSNAKLLYINRALENASLNERQKQKIVESISKATTVQEAKIVFDTLHETVSSSSAEKRTSSLNEAISRRSTLLVAAREEQKQTEVNPAFERLRKLAGIKQ